MKSLYVTFIVLAWFASNPLAVVGVPTFGRAGELLRAADVAAIARLAGSELLAIEAHRGQVLPEAWHAFAYLQPESEIQGVRQGRLVELESPVRNEIALRWRVTTRDGRYAQVAVSPKGFPERIGSADLHRPFKVTGAFSPAQLLELIAYVRSSPRRPPIPDAPDGTSHIDVPDQLKGRLPLVQLERVNRSTVEIWLADNFHSGEHAVLHYRDGRWHLGKITLYIVWVQPVT
jgi:hypothetical protein